MSAGAVLTKANLTKSLFPNPTQYKTARYPRILLTSEEMQEVKSVQPKGRGFDCSCQNDCTDPHIAAGICSGFVANDCNHGRKDDS